MCWKVEFYFSIYFLHVDIFKLNTVQCKFFSGEVSLCLFAYICVCVCVCVCMCMACLRRLHLFAGCVWGPRWSSLCQMSEALQRQPLGVLFHLLSYCCGADMQIRCNERSLCGGSGGGGGMGGELRNLKWRKGRWRKKVIRRQSFQIAEHKNLRGLVKGYVRSVGSDRKSSPSNQTFISPLLLLSPLRC